MFIYIIVILFVLIWIKFFLHKPFQTCEDTYQHLRKVLNEKQSDIIATVEYPTTPVTKYHLQRNLIRVDRELAPYSSPESHPDPENMFTDLLEFQACTTYNTKGWLDLPNKKLVYFVNHEFIGGSKLAHSFQIVHKCRQKNVFYQTKWWYIIPALKLWWKRHLIPTVSSPLPLCTHDHDVRRFLKTYTIDKCVNLKATILHTVLSDVHRALHLQRPLVAYLPIAFVPSPTVNNNIGLLWLTFDPQTDTVESTAEKMKANMYQVLGTNFLLYHNLLPRAKNGGSTRKGVDAVVTMIFGEEAENIIKSWTYKSVSEYPVYAAVSPIIDNVTKQVYITQTLTVSTPLFDETQIVGEYVAKPPEYYLIDC
jgi:hypothetical protein